MSYGGATKAPNKAHPRKGRMEQVMRDDLRKNSKGNRRKVVKDVKKSQKAAVAGAAKRSNPHKGEKPKRARKSRALEGADVWLRKIRNAFGARAAREVFDLVASPGRETLTRANKMLAAHTVLLLDAQTRMEKAIGTEAEPSVRAYLEDGQKTCRVAKDLAMGLVRVRAQFVDEELDSRPDAIELVGAEEFRSQLTTLTANPSVKH